VETHDRVQCVGADGDGDDEANPDKNGRIRAAQNVVGRVLPPTRPNAAA